MPGDPTYYELNLSPGGDWNLYGFSGERSGMHPVATEPPRFQTIVEGTSTLRTLVHLQLPEALGSALDVSELEISLAAVVEYRNGSCEYRALTHAGDRPDFHRRDSFVLRLRNS